MLGNRNCSRVRRQRNDGSRAAAIVIFPSLFFFYYLLSFVFNFLAFRLLCFFFFLGFGRLRTGLESSVLLSMFCASGVNNIALINCRSVYFFFPEKRFILK